ncbi:uncharacterized protein LOC118442357 [Vespa mandarinia]|uniref:uncharacterized protein LOC118442357 n=1 Tax=Vespa mandarinia TaxID=7446 RepID=UPI0016090FF0|nr:uncharacterized protein LOC118442357 [Vespa mandarinia]
MVIIVPRARDLIAEAPDGIKGLQSFPGGPCNSQQEEKRMRVLQGNLNRSRTAHHLLTQLCSEKKADIVLISEQYQDRTGVGWYADELGTAAIWIPDTRLIHVSDQGSGRGYVWVRHNSTTYVSVYRTPNDRIDDFQIKLDDLEDALRKMQGDLIVAGDLNAKALEWGEARPDSRGRRIMEVASRLELSVLNTGSTSTFHRPGYRETIPDVSLANEHLVARVTGWQVIEDYTGSDHQYILFDVHDRKPAVTSVKRPPRWNIARMDRERLSSVIEEGWRSQQSTSASLSPPTQARLISAATMQLIQKACAIAVPKNGTKWQRRPVYWWTNEIADLRKKCLRLRRLAQRAKRSDHDAAPLAADYQAAMKALKRTIKASQRRCWKELCLDVDQNPWGLGYQIVTIKLGTNTQGIPQDARTLENIIHTLFPSHPKREIRTATPGSPEGPQFTKEELLKAASSMRNKKASGLDGLPVEGGHLPRPVEESQTGAHKRGKGPADAASSYRPIYMLDTAGKLLEKLLRPRLHAALRAAGDLAARQYGFRSGLSTIQAVQEVVTAAKMMERGNHLTRPLCLLATLDCPRVPTPNTRGLSERALPRIQYWQWSLKLGVNIGGSPGLHTGTGYLEYFLRRCPCSCHNRKRHVGGTAAAQPGHAQSHLLDGRPRAISGSLEDRDRATYEEAHQHLVQLHCRRHGGPG